MSFATFSDYGEAGCASIMDATEVKLVTSGRMGIALALKHMGVGRGDKVLVPAYHCSSMVEPVLSLGATPVFFRLGADTGVDFDDVVAKFDSHTRVLMLTHYFGFPQDAARARSICDAHGVQLLEDCAHAFFGEFGGQPLGSFGDYAIASPWKFFPAYDGGCLASARHPLADIVTKPSSIAFQIKATINTLERSFEYERLRPLDMVAGKLLRLKDWLWGRIKAARTDSMRPIGSAALDGAFAFEADWADKRMTLSSNLILRLASKMRIVKRRRAAYQRMLDGLAGLPGSRPLFDRLPPFVVPYVFPLLVDLPETVFPLLRQRGVPMYRFGEFLWDGVDAKTCPVSVDLSRRVLQFPCHQEFEVEEIDWMIKNIRQVLLDLVPSTQPAPAPKEYQAA